MTNKNNPKTTAIIPQDRGTKQPIIIVISSSTIHKLITRTARRRGGDGERATPPKQRRQISFVKGGSRERERELWYDSWSFTEIRLSVQLLLLQLLKALNRTRVSLADLSFAPSPLSSQSLVAVVIVMLCSAKAYITLTLKQKILFDNNKKNRNNNNKNPGQLNMKYDTKKKETNMHPTRDRVHAEEEAAAATENKQSHQNCWPCCCMLYACGCQTMCVLCTCMSVSNNNNT